LNATFGNAAELIIAVVALSKGLSSVVKASITGSIIGNILPVFGLSILREGTKYSEQRFNRTGAGTSAISLSLAAIALIIPTVFHMAANLSPGGWSPIMEQRLSLAIALVLFVTYLCVLSFSLKTHRHFFQGVKGEPEEKSEELTGVLKDLRFKLTRDARSRLAFLQTEWQGPLLFRQLRAC
jgi:Ca2+:H+ antiporter